MPRKKKEKLVHFDIDTLSKQPAQKEVAQPVSLGQTLKAKREKKKLSLALPPIWKTKMNLVTAPNLSCV